MTADAGLRPLTVALGDADLDTHALWRRAIDQGAFAAWGLQVELLIVDAEGAVDAVLAGQADLAITASQPVIDALAAGEPLAVYCLLRPSAIVLHERALRDRIEELTALLAVIGFDYGRQLGARHLGA